MIHNSATAAAGCQHAGELPLNFAIFHNSLVTLRWGCAMSGVSTPDGTSRVRVIAYGATIPIVQVDRPVRKHVRSGTQDGVPPQLTTTVMGAVLLGMRNRSGRSRNPKP
jgi:hypothetical protein